MDLKKQLDRKYKILSLDGGGIRGIIFLVFLAALEKALGKKCCEIFDLIVGTSTGGIAGAMLARGHTARGVLELYVRDGKKIFRKKFLGFVLPWNWWGGLYDRSYIDAMCDRYLDCKMRDLKCQFIATAVRMEDTQFTHFFKSYKPKYADKKVSEMVKRTYSAPYYFGYYRDEDGTWSDGGVGLQTCTLMESYIETIRQKKRSYWILNCGCGYLDLKRKAPTFIISQLADFLPIAREQSIWRQVLNCRALGVNFTTANILIDKKCKDMDCVGEIDRLVAYGERLAAEML